MIMIPLLLLANNFDRYEKTGTMDILEVFADRSNKLYTIYHKNREYVVNSLSENLEVVNSWTFYRYITFRGFDDRNRIVLGVFDEKNKGRSSGPFKLVKMDGGLTLRKYNYQVTEANNNLRLSSGQKVIKSLTFRSIDSYDFFYDQAITLRSHEGRYSTIKYFDLKSKTEKDIDIQIPPQSDMYFAEPYSQILHVNKRYILMFYRFNQSWLIESRIRPLSGNVFDNVLALCILDTKNGSVKPLVSFGNEELPHDVVPNIRNNFAVRSNGDIVILWNNRLYKTRLDLNMLNGSL